MNVTTTTLLLTPRDPIVARDGRPFGVGQGRRMYSMPWPLPSVVAGSFRTALVKANPNLDFNDNMPERLKQIEVAGVFPAVDETLYLPAPLDAVAEPGEKTDELKHLHRARPEEADWEEALKGGCDFPNNASLRPVVLSRKVDDFKPCAVPAWWPVDELAAWLLEERVDLDSRFLNEAVRETRDHVCLDARRGAAAEGLIFTTVSLNVRHLPRYGVSATEPFRKRFADVHLSARVTIKDGEFDHFTSFDLWHPLGGERRLVHWRRGGTAPLWHCPDKVQHGLNNAKRVRMVLATPAIFKHGWRPGWIDAEQLTGKPFDSAPMLRLVGVANRRWQAVSGWSLAAPRGPKPIRRMVPAGSVYFFEVVDGSSSSSSSKLGAEGWLRSISDDEQDRRDGFGLAVWGIWNTC